jgi:hypothetical protein
MSSFVEYTLENGGIVRVQTVSGNGTGKEQEGGEQAPPARSLDEALSGIKNTAGQMIQTFKSLNIDEMELSFGMIADCENGCLLICHKHADANFEVKLRWRSSHRPVGPGLT